MSELAKLDAEFYTIRSVAGYSWRSVAGIARVGLTLPVEELVRVDDAEITIWKIKRQGEPGLFQLSLRDSYRYSGVTPDGRNVIVTTEKSRDQAWRIKFWPESGAFTIELNTGDLPVNTWALPKEMRELLIGNYELQPDKSQLFKIEPVLE